MSTNAVTTKIAKGLVAGAVGTAVMTVSSNVEMRLRGRKPSSTPAEAAGKVLGVEPVGEPEKERFSNIVHWAYGIAWGAGRGVLGALGLKRRAGTFVHLLAVWGSEATTLPALGVTPPITDWEPKEIAIDLWHHLVYAAATGAAYQMLDR